MTETTTVSASDILCNLKAVVTDLECQQKQQLFKQLQKQLEQQRQLQKRQQQQLEQNNKSPGQPPMFLMIPIEDTQKCEGDKRSRTACNGREHDNSSSKGSTRGCGSGKNSSKGHDKKSHRDRDPVLELKETKSRELRAGILYTGCGCMHRDGLQDCCPRSECQGQPACLVKPWAVCPPRLLCQARHPESFGMPPNPNAVTF